MFEGLIDQFIATVQDKFTSLVVSPITSWIDFQMFHWYLWAAVIAVGIGTVGWFLPFKWVRASLGFILLLVAAYVAGGYEMHKEMAAKAAKKTAKKNKSK